MKTVSTFLSDLKAISPLITSFTEWQEFSRGPDGIRQYIICEKIAETIIAKWNSSKEECINILNLIESYLIERESAIENLAYTDFVPSFCDRSDPMVNEIMNHFGSNTHKLYLKYSRNFSQNE